MSGPVEPGRIQVSPENRLPVRTRRSHDIGRDARLAWTMAGHAVQHRAPLVVAVAVGWGALRLLCLHGLIRQGGAALPAGGERALALLCIATLRLWPLLPGAVLMPPIQRFLLDAPEAGIARIALQIGRMFVALFCLLTIAVAALLLCTVLPLSLRGTLGNLSTLLLAILLLPGAMLAWLGVFRLCFGLPAISLDLKRSLVEGWMISQGHILRGLTVCVISYAPLAALAIICRFAAAGPLTWASILLVPLVQTAAVTLTACLTALLYRRYRLPAAFRPDERPSHNRSRRRQPAFP